MSETRFVCVKESANSRGVDIATAVNDAATRILNDVPFAMKSLLRYFKPGSALRRLAAVPGSVVRLW
jgi:hypothetical protein